MFILNMFGYLFITGHLLEILLSRRLFLLIRKERALLTAQGKQPFFWFNLRMFIIVYQIHE